MSTLSTNSTNSLPFGVLRSLQQTNPHEELQQKTEPKEKQKLEEIAAIDSAPLLKVKTAFPFILFPVVITVDRVKVTVEDHYFFFSKSVRSMLVKDIMNIVVEESLLFSLVRFTDRLIPQDTVEVANLAHDDANRLRQIVQGLMVAEKEGIDVTKIDHADLKTNLNRIGKVTS